MNDDLIRRSDAIRAAENVSENYTKEDDREWHPHIDFITQALIQVPSVSSKSIRGKWIDEAVKLDASFGMHDYRCSNCNSYADEYIGGYAWYTMYKPNFCPNCGADMREYKEGE